MGQSICFKLMELILHQCKYHISYDDYELIKTSYSLSMIPISYFKSTWSISKIYLDDSYNICGFLNDTELMGLYLLFKFHIN